MALSTEQIVARFNRAATTYDDVAGLQRGMADRLLAMFLQVPGNPERALSIADLGCGTGYLIQQLLLNGQRDVTGFDLASKMLDVTRDRIAAQPETASHTSAVRLVESDLQSLPVSAGQFDVIFSNAAIQWCDSNAAIAEIKRALKPGGQIYISTFGPRTLEQWKSAFTHKDAGNNETRVHAFDSAAQLKHIIEAHDLTVAKVENRIEHQTFETVKSMFGSIQKLGASNAQTNRPPLKKSTYREIQNHFQETLSQTGSLELTFETIFIHAQN